MPRPISLPLIVLFSVLVFGGWLQRPSVAADSPDDLRAQVAKLMSQVETLKAENETLKKENQSLRRMLATPSSQPARPTAPTPSPPAASKAPASTVQPPAPKPAGYWITTSSGVRHNSSCRYYMNSNGRAGGPNEGRPCKVCGG